MSDQVAVAASVQCPDCGGQLNSKIEGFRPATSEELGRLSPETVRLLGLCTNPECPGRTRVPHQRSHG